MGEDDIWLDRMLKRRWVARSVEAAYPPDASALLQQVQAVSGFSYRRLDLKSGQLDVGKNYAEVFGFPLPPSAQDFTQFVHPDDRGSFEELRRTLFCTIGRQKLIFRVVLTSGEVRWIETRAETLPDENGKPANILLTSRNITRLRYADMELAASKEHLSRVQAAGRIGTWETDFATGKESWSPEAWELVEPGGKGEATMERWLAAIHPDDREAAWRRTEEAMESGHYEHQFRVVHPDGSVHWLRAAGTVERSSGGGATLMRGTVTDITERMQADEALSRLAMIIESSPDFVGWADLDGRAVYVNPAGRRMCGFDPRDNLAGLSILDFVAPHHHQRMTGEVRETTRRDGIWSGEIDMLDRNGKVFPVSKVSILHKDGAGQPLYMSTVSRDISKEKKSEEALREADRRKDEFLATLAHELRNPLAPLQSVADMMKELETRGPSLAAVRRIIEQQTAHLTRLVDDLLDVSRLTSGKLELQRSPLDVCEAVRAAADMCRRDLDARGHTLELLPSETPLRVSGDVFRLTQVLANLIGNAAKYTPDRGLIQVRTRLDASDVLIEVRDNGVGIAADFIPKVFDAFAQATEQRQRAAGGLGLGLMLVKQIIDLHDGKVSASSDGIGQGSTFEIRLPMLVATAAALPAGRTEPSSAGQLELGTRILVVDDYAAIRDSMELLLTMKGCVVETAASGAEALARVPIFKPDAILMDVRMPGMSGYDVARALRKLPAQLSFRLVAMTGDGTPADRRLALEAGFDEHVVKPVSVSRIVEVLAGCRLKRRAVA